MNIVSQANQVDRSSDLLNSWEKCTNDSIIEVFHLFGELSVLAAGRNRCGKIKG